MIPRRRFLALTAGPLALALSGCGGKSGPPTLRVGMNLGYPPFEMQDKSGQPDGVSVRLAEALASRLGRPLQIVPMEFAGLIPALKHGNIDLVISSMTATEERGKSIAFSEPYAFTGLALLVRKDADVRSIDDLKAPGRTLAVKAGTTGETWAIDHLPAARRVVFEDATACVLEVAQGRADAFIYDQLSIYKYAAQNPDTTRALLEPFVQEAWAIGVARENGELLEKVNAFLRDFRQEKGLDALGERYLKEEKSALEAAGIPFILR